MSTYQLSEEELKKLREVEVELLCEVHRICEKCGIRYTIIAGTLLGSVRHKGFIPWDDDADVALLRPEYDKFVEAVKTELDTTRFYFQDHTNTPGYRWGYGKLRRKGTVFMREHQEHMPYEQGIFIDVFPLDKVPQNKLFRAVHNVECFVVRKFLWSEVGRVSERNPFWRSLYKWMSRVSTDRIFKHYDAMKNHWNRKSSAWVRILTFPTPGGDYGYLKNWYQSRSLYPFEGHMFYGISEADAYLQFKYGDYQKLPPKEQRKVHPVSKFKA